MMIQSLGATTSAQAALNEARQPNELDKNAFLMLLITQMRNQDPLSPVEDKEFIAQLAQFSSLEQMQQVNSTLEPFIQMMEPFLQNQTSFAAASWVGRTVVASDPNPPKDSDGKLLNVVVDEDGEPVMNSSGDLIPLNLTTKVEGVRFTTDQGPLLQIKIKQKVWNPETSEIVEKEVQKEIPLSSVYSVT